MFNSKTIITIIIAFIVVVAAFSLIRFERIDAGHEGIKVNLYGSDKGVDDVSLVTGIVWYCPLVTAVYEYPTYVQTVDYDPFTVNAKDGSEFICDPTVSLKVIDTTSPQVFRKYRRTLPEVIQGAIRNYVRDAFRIQINKYTTDEIVSNRDTVERAIETQLIEVLEKENFHLEQLTTGLQYPKSIVEAVNAKNAAIQQAQKANNELAVVQAEAEKKLVAARAEAEANRLRTQSLNDLVLRQMWIDKWDGHLPQVTSEATPMVGLK